VITMAKRIRTIFISDDSVNVVVVEGKRVKKWASLLLEPGMVSQGVVIDEAQVASKIKELLKAVKEGAGRYVVGLSGLNSLYRLISLPELPEAILPEAVKQEAGRVIPVPLDEVYLSYQRIPSLVGETRVFLAAFPRNVADALHRTLKAAGIEPYIMDLAPLALCRTLNESRAIIVNTRLDNLDIIVMVDRLPQLIRTLSLPGEVASLAEKVPTITEEIDRTVAFYNSSHKEQPLDATVPMFVCGDLAQTPESWQSLSGRLNCPVSILPSPVESPESFNLGEFMVNIGLAFKELFPEKGEASVSLVNFNALPKMYLPKAVPVSAILMPVCVIIGAGILVYMGIMLRNSTAQNELLRSELAAIETRVTEERVEIATLAEQVSQLGAEVAPLEARADVFETTFDSLGDGRALVDKHMDDIVMLVPADAEFIELNHEDEVVTINGLVAEEIDAEDDIFAYARSLRSRYVNFVVSSIEAAETEEGEFIGYEFELLME
jgi:type IV pilus assembly protein PilM